MTQKHTKPQLLRLYIEKASLTKYPDTLDSWTKINSDGYYPNHKLTKSWNFITLKEAQAIIAKYARQTYDVRHSWADGWKDQLIEIPHFNITQALKDGESYTDYVNILPRWAYEYSSGGCLIAWETYIWEMRRQPRLNPNKFPKGMVMSAGVTPSLW